MSGPRPVRAPRGTELTCKGWPQEAALRMLMNNLDPEVAERPDDLVVYGGTGKAARNWAAFDAIVREPARPRGRRDAAGAVGPAGRGLPHARLGAAGAARQLQPGAGLGDLGGVPPARAARPDDVRPDDRRLVDLHRHPGHPAGHVRDVRRGRRRAAAATLAGTITLTAGLRRDGRRAAARRHHERRRRALRRRATRAGSTGGSSTATSTCRPPTSTTALALAVEARDAGRALSIGVVGNAAEVLARAAAPRRPDRRRDRPDQRARPAVATCRPG